MGCQRRFTVKAWRGLARNVGASLHKADPVVVTGRLQVEEWQGGDGPRTSLVIEATSIGHDLSRGRSLFARTVEGESARKEVPAEPDADSDGGGPGGPDPDDPSAQPALVPAAAAAEAFHAPRAEAAA